MPLQEGVIMEHLSQRGIVTMMPGQQIIVGRRGGQVNIPVITIFKTNYIRNCEI